MTKNRLRSERNERIRIKTRTARPKSKMRRRTNKTRKPRKTRSQSSRKRRMIYNLSKVHAYTPLTSEYSQNWRSGALLPPNLKRSPLNFRRNFYQMRIDKIRNAEIAKRNRERLKDPSLFPSAPTGDL
jgi:hypothetical protein